MNLCIIFLFIYYSICFYNACIARFVCVVCLSKSPTSGFFLWNKNSKEKKEKEKDKKEKKGKKEAIAVAVEVEDIEEKKKGTSWLKRKDDGKNKESKKEKDGKDKESNVSMGKEGELDLSKESAASGKDKNKDKKDKTKDKDKGKDKDKSKDKDKAKSKDKGKDKDKNKDKNLEKDKAKDKSTEKGPKDTSIDREEEIKSREESLMSIGSGKEESLVSDKDRSLASTLIEDTPGFTKTYDYVEVEGEGKHNKLVGAFSYEKGKTKDGDGSGEKPTSPGKRQIGVAFNYAPGEAKKVADAAEKRKEKPQYIASSPKVTGRSSDISGSASPIQNTSIITNPGSIQSENSPRSDNNQTPSMYTSSYVTDVSYGTEGSYSMDDSRMQSSMSSFGKTSYDDGMKGSYPYGADPTARSPDSTRQYGFVDQNGQPLDSSHTKNQTSTPASSNQSTDTSRPYGFVDPSYRNSTDPSARFIESESAASGTPLGPKIVKTTTKQSVVKEGSELTQNIEEKIEDLNSGEVTVNTQVNKVNKMYLNF